MLSTYKGIFGRRPTQACGTDAMEGRLAITCMAAVLAAAFVMGPGDAVAQGAVQAIVNRGNSTRDNLVLIGNSILGVVIAGLGTAASMNKLDWKWAGGALGGGAVINGVLALQGWLASTT